MNIFENYLLKIEKVIKSAHKDNLLELPDNLSGINVDIPPAKFTGDISTNVAMVLSKINKKSPLELAKQIADLIKNSDNNIDEISIEKLEDTAQSQALMSARIDENIKAIRETLEKMAAD